MPKPWSGIESPDTSQRHGPSECCNGPCLLRGQDGQFENKVFSLRSSKSFQKSILDFFLSGASRKLSDHANIAKDANIRQWHLGIPGNFLTFPDSIVKLSRSDAGNLVETLEWYMVSPSCH